MQARRFQQASRSGIGMRDVTVTLQLRATPRERAEYQRQWQSVDSKTQRVHRVESTRVARAVK